MQKEASAKRHIKLTLPGFYTLFFLHMLVKEVITIATESRDVITCIQQIKSYLAKTNAKSNVK